MRMELASLPGRAHEIEIEKAKGLFRHLFEGSLQERKHSLRADVIKKLDECQATHNGVGWAIFSVPEGGEEEGSVLTKNKEVMISIYRNTEGGVYSSVPVIRIITNTEIIDGNDKPCYLCEDFILDHEGDAQYNFGVSYGYHEDIVEDENGYSFHNGAILFTVADGKLIFSANYDPQTYVDIVPDMNVETGKIRSEIYPFGNYDNPFDHDYALQKASDIFAEIASQDPTHIDITFHPGSSL